MVRRFIACATVFLDGVIADKTHTQNTRQQSFNTYLEPCTHNGMQCDNIYTRWGFQNNTLHEHTLFAVITGCPGSWRGGRPLRGVMKDKALRCSLEYRTMAPFGGHLNHEERESTNNGK